ncbi:fimbria/pilus outer membrane usher protein [Pseudomonas lurida]|uniref:fimbria/pilus outer membrane usher protein n=1 Tax=Pseudomonas lurida TaxID=244566 RepID=UPI001FD09093|nr:fimbria/pilus outer membrane usher protein [Pseudomonas lurida]
MHFNDAFLPEDSRSLQLEQYEKGNPVLPGQYRADIAVNSKLLNRKDIRIDAEPDGSRPVVCFSRSLLEQVGVDIQKLSVEAAASLDETTCKGIEQLIPGSTASFNPSSQQLDVSIPQIALRRSSRGYVSPELWDRGVTAGNLSYSFNANHNNANTGTYDSAYLGLSTGLNLGDWRLRHNGSLSWQSTSGQNYQAINTYAQRDVTFLQSQLVVGEANTSGEVFDTFNYRGVQLSTDDRMLPQSQRGYAPVIQGIARTAARVAVRQAGNLLYETTVAPGRFVIDDLYSTGYGGDLEVTVYEADGSEQRFTVPFASTAELLRPGISRFSVTAGETRNSYINHQARLAQGTYQLGLSNIFTGYGGAQASDDYRAMLGGLAFGTPIGAVGVDVTQAQTNLRSGDVSGQSVRMTYSKNFAETGSNLAVAAMRFSTEEYLGFNDALQLLDIQRSGYDSKAFGRSRSRLSLTANQSLGVWGQLVFSGFTQNYWNRTGSDVQYQLSYSQQVSQVSYGLSVSRNRVGLGEMDTTLMLTASMPLEFGSSQRTAQISATMLRDNQGYYSEQASLSGIAGEEDQYSYSLTSSHEGVNRTNSTSVSGQYTGPKAVVGATISQGADYKSLSLNASGSIVAHPQGVTFTPYRSETMAVVTAEGAEGAKVPGYPGVRVDSYGNAVVPYLRPYELNEISIDPFGTSLNVELNETSQQIAPRAGAVVALKYGTTDGEALLLNVMLDDGSLLPFGASVVDERGVSVGVVGQGGQLYARVKDDTRQLLINWGSQATQQCVLPLPPVKNDGKHLRQVEVVCSVVQLEKHFTPVNGVGGSKK